MTHTTVAEVRRICGVTSTDKRRRAFYSNGFFIPFHVTEKPKLDKRSKKYIHTIFRSNG